MVKGIQAQTVTIDRESKLDPGHSWIQFWGFRQILLVVAAIFLGWAASSSHGLLIVGGFVGVLFSIAVAWSFQQDGPGTLLGFWILQLLLVPASALVGYTSSLGAAVRQCNDVITAVFVVMCIWNLVAKRSSVRPLRYVLAGCGVAICGLASSLIASAELTVTTEGAWLGLKIWTLIAIALCVPWRSSDIQRIFRVFQYSGIVVALIGVLDYLTHGGVATALHTSSYATATGAGAYRANAIRAIFATPGEYSLCMSLLFGVALTSYSMWRRPQDLASALFFAVAVALALRLKGALSIGAAMAVVVACKSQHRRRGIEGVLVLAVILAIGLLSFEGNILSRQVSTYATAGSEANVRGLLYQTSEKIAIQHFPLGVGFGRFGSYTSSKHYSTVYDDYDLSDIWGLSRVHPAYISDTAWPSVIGETGVLGLICFLGGLIFIGYAALRVFRKGSAVQAPIALALLCSLAVLLVDSLGDPNLFDWFAVTTIALLVGPVFGGWRESKSE